MSAEQSHEKLKKIDANTTEEQLIEIYKMWSKTYDKDVASDIGYVGAKLGAEHLSDKLKERGMPNDVNIIDMGCGTGLIGERLHQLGYTNIDGVDISPESIEIAKTKGVYQRLHCGYMASNGCEKLGIAENQYDVAICIGVFTVGHVKGKGLDDLVHAVKPGGLACFTIRDCVASDPQYGYNEKMDELCEQKKWKLVSKSYNMYQMVNNLKSWSYVFEIL